MSDPRLDALGDKLKAFEEKRQGGRKPDQNDDASATEMNAGARAGMELVVSVVAGCALGYGLDRWLGTAPWLMILFLFLGMGAGFMSVYRINNKLDSSIGFAALQKAQKNVTKPPEIEGDEED